MLSAVADLGENRIHRILVRTLLFFMVIEWVLLLLDGQWLQTFLVTLIIFILFIPILFKNKLSIELPAEFHIAGVIFAFAGIYLGEIHRFYDHFWWWDIALHTTAGFLLGIVGFLLVYFLNESRRVEMKMTSGFIAFFAFTFSVSIGTFWEIFEFSMDQFFGTNMQKPMLGDPSGLTDTMWDMIVNAIGALIVSITGWWYLKFNKSFFIKRWIRNFIRRNPQWFKE